MKKHKLDLMLIIFILLIAFISYVGINILTGSKGNYVRIIVNGNIEKELPLNKNTTYNVTLKESGNEIKNVVVINEQGAYIKEADCPDKTCVRQGSISKNGQSIICLPHKLVVTIVSDKDSDIDAVAN